MGLEKSSFPVFISKGMMKLIADQVSVTTSDLTGT